MLGINVECVFFSTIIVFSVTGQFGGARSAVQLRVYVGCLGMLAVPKQVAVPLAHQAITPEGVTTDQKLTGELDALLEHVYWAARAVKAYSNTEAPPPWSPS